MPIKTPPILVDRSTVKLAKQLLIKRFEVNFEGPIADRFEQPIEVEAFSASEAVGKVMDHCQLEAGRYKSKAVLLSKLWSVMPSDPLGEYPFGTNHNNWPLTVAAESADAATDAVSALYDGTPMKAERAAS